MIKKIIDTIHKNHSFILTAHMNLEGDALGSELAVYLALKKLKKKVVVVNHDLTPEIYNFLPGVKTIRHEFKDEKVDVAIVLDCSDPDRPGRVKDYLSRAKCIINIDHHISNTHFGDLNWVKPQESSTCQMLYRLCEKLNTLDRDIALCLYTGIFTDTGKFSYSNTNADTHRIVANLMKYNINPPAIYEKINSLCVPEDMNVIGKIVASLKFDDTHAICWAPIDKWVDGDHDLTEVIFSIMRLLKGVEVFILFKNIGKTQVRVNFRSRARVDVNRIAKFFGGGGHKRASGTTMDGTLQSVEKQVTDFVLHCTAKKRK